VSTTNKRLNPRRRFMLMGIEQLPVGAVVVVLLALEAWAAVK
jgi:hypothetical protein